jgi:hypothetical protein
MPSLLHKPPLDLGCISADRMAIFGGASQLCMQSRSTLALRRGLRSRAGMYTGGGARCSGPMLRRATTELHRQCLTHHPLSKRLQNSTHRCPFSSLPEIRDDASAEQAENSTTRALPGAGDPSRASAPDDNATPITRHGRIRSLRPILVPPSFPSSQLLPVMSIPEPETSPSSDLNTETDLFSSSSSSTTTTVKLIYLPKNTVEADILPVFNRFGEIAHISVRPQGRRGEVVFADVHGVTRTLHASAEEPLRVRGDEIIVFRKYVEVDTVSDMDTDTDTPWQATGTERGHNGGVIFVSDLPRMSTEEELAEALELFGAYENFVMRMSFALLSLSS